MLLLRPSSSGPQDILPTYGRDDRLVGTIAILRFMQHCWSAAAIPWGVLLRVLAAVDVDTTLRLEGKALNPRGWVKTPWAASASSQDELRHWLLKDGVAHFDEAIPAYFAMVDDGIAIEKATDALLFVLQLCSHAVSATHAQALVRASDRRVFAFLLSSIP